MRTPCSILREAKGHRGWAQSPHCPPEADRRQARSRLELEAADLRSARAPADVHLEFPGLDDVAARVVVKAELLCAQLERRAPRLARPEREFREGLELAQRARAAGQGI